MSIISHAIIKDSMEMMIINNSLLVIDRITFLPLETNTGGFNDLHLHETKTHNEILSSEVLKPTLLLV